MMVGFWAGRSRARARSSPISAIYPALTHAFSQQTYLRLPDLLVWLFVRLSGPRRR